MQEGNGRLVSDPDLEEKEGTPVWEVESVLLYYRRVAGNYNHSPSGCHLQHTNAAEQVIHIWSIVCSGEEVLVQFSYQSYEKVQPRFHG